MKILVIIVLLSFASKNCPAQINLYSDIFRGGVTVFGVSTADALFDANIVLNDFTNNSIRKVFVTYYGLVGENYSLENTYYFIINNDTIKLNKNDDWNIYVPNNIINPNVIYTGHFAFFKDITNQFININDSITINWQNLYIPPAFCPSCRYGAPMITILYENDTMDVVNYQLVINNKPNDVSSTLNVTNLNPMNMNKDIGLSLQSDRIVGTNDDGYNCYLNNNFVGKLSHFDSIPLGHISGVMGNYYYENGIMTGLTDDIANDSLVDSDGIIKLNNYLTNNTSFNFKFDYFLPPNFIHNFLISLNLSYSTPCDTFPTTVQDKIQVCKGDSVQMQVASASLSHLTFEWEPAEGLSCDTCAQPYFTDTVSRWYTVRIWNNDSCSKVLPVRVEVLDNPPSPIITVSPTKCSDSSGVATVQIAESSYLYNVNNGALQNANVFNNLFAGVHTVSAIDTNGCRASSDISIQETYPKAVFTATPQQGDVPLDVDFHNTSVGANNFIWYIDQDTLQSVNTAHTFNTEGNFNATLVAYDTYPQCADTMSVNIFAEYPFTIFAPSLQEDKKGNYQIYTSGVKSLSYHLYNALGQIIYTKELENLQGYIDLWSAYTVAKGTYIFKIIAIGENGEEKVVSGKVVVV